MEVLLNEGSLQKALKQISRYFLVGGMAFGVDVGTFTLARLAFGQDLLWANVTARSAGAFWAFMLNHGWTFKKHKNRVVWQPVFRYSILWCVNTIFSTIFLRLVIQRLDVLEMETLAKVAIDIIIMIINFLVCRLWVFK